MFTISLYRHVSVIQLRKPLLLILSFTYIQIQNGTYLHNPKISINKTTLQFRIRLAFVFE